MFQPTGYQSVAEQLRAQLSESPKLRAQLDRDRDPAVLWVYGDIGGEVDAGTLVREIELLPRDKTILVRINSAGGSAYDGLAIYAALRGRTVITRIDGIAASAAAIIALAGRPVQILSTGHMFIHRALASATGNSRVMRSTAEWLDRVDESIIEVIQAKTGAARDVVEQWLDGDVDGTLFSADEALQARLADVIIDAEQQDSDAATSGVGSTERTNHPRNYVPSDPPGGEGEGVEGVWERPRLYDFTDRPWSELTVDERRAIAAHFAYAFSLDSFDDLVLPHHFPPSHPDSGRASLDGVRNALARLPLTEGIPEADRERIREHLYRHLPPKPEDERVDELLELALQLIEGGCNHDCSGTR